LLSLKEETDADGNKLTNIEIKALLLVSYFSQIHVHTSPFLKLIKIGKMTLSLAFF